MNKRERDQPMEDDWEDVPETQPRKIVKVKKAEAKPGEDIGEFEDSQEDEFEQEDIVQNDKDDSDENNEWVSDEEDVEMKQKPA